MNPKDVVSNLVLVVLVLVALALFLGQLLGQPVLLGYVETGSMEPTLNPGDGFVAIPSAIAGPVEEGDVVTYNAEFLQGGGLTTHRVVSETDRGYVTSGDANPFTDQENVEPPVRDQQIVAEALQVNGGIVVIPHLGTVTTGIQDALGTLAVFVAILTGGLISGPQGLAYAFLAMALVYYVVDATGEGGRRPVERVRSRETGIDARLVVGAFTALLVLSATAGMVAPSGPQQYAILSAEFTSEQRPDVIYKGGSKTTELTVANGGPLPVVTFFEPGSEMTEVSTEELSLPARSERTVEATFHAPEDIGSYRRYVVEHRYLAVLPLPVIRALYHVHPWAPVVAIDALIAGAFLALTLPFLPNGRVRDRSRDTKSAISRLVRRLKGYV